MSYRPTDGFAPSGIPGWLLRSAIEVYFLWLVRPLMRQWWKQWLDEHKGKR